MVNVIYRVKSTKHCFIRDLKPALNENVGSENLFLYWFTPDVVFFLHCCLASYQYLALVFVFLNLVIFCNRHFWGCMLQQTKRQVKYTMRNLIVMFVTAVCFLFLLKLKWPKNKNFYDVTCFFCDIRSCWGIAKKM